MLCYVMLCYVILSQKQLIGAGALRPTLKLGDPRYSYFIFAEKRKKKMNINKIKRLKAVLLKN